MSPNSCRSIVVSLLLTVWLSSLAAAQDNACGVAVAKAFKYKGSVACERCHRQPLPQDSQDFVLLTESKIWRNEDKHSMAMRLLVGIERNAEGKLFITDAPEKLIGLQMLRRLGVLSEEEFNATVAAAKEAAPKLREAADDTVAYRIEADYFKPVIDKCWKSKIGRGCLACHAGVEKEFPKGFDEAGFRNNSVPDGVSCEACHGPSEQWDGPHDDMAWRAKSPKEKSELGLIDLRNPAMRANQCYSCHVGDAAQGKFIEHSWYMAGHPPLPSIEAETFANAMPRHWRYLNEKPDFENRKEYVSVNLPTGQDGSPFPVEANLPRTKAVLLGGVVALRKSAELLATSHENTDSFIPDFAAFDCFACHQELRTEPVITRGRFDPTIPGRPNIPRWSFALADITVEVSANAEATRGSFDQEVNALRNALTRRPFGHPALIKESTARLAQSLCALEADLAKRPMTIESATWALNRIVKDAISEDVDFHTARQLVWAAQIIATEIRQRKTGGVWEEIDNDVTALFKVKVTGTDSEPQELSSYLRVGLPSGSKRSISSELGLTLFRIDRFEPRSFREAMLSIRKDLLPVGTTPAE